MFLGKFDLEFPRLCSSNLGPNDKAQRNKMNETEQKSISAI